MSLSDKGRSSKLLASRKHKKGQNHMFYFHISYLLEVLPGSFNTKSNSFYDGQSMV